MVLVRNKRRALSTVVTTTIMLTAVAVIGAGVVAWANTNSRTFESILVSSASDKLNKINEMPKIENVVLTTKLAAPFSQTPGFKGINVTVSNIGTLGFNVTKIKISDSSTSLTCTTNDTSIGFCKRSITPQSSKWFAVIYGYTNGLLTTVEVTTNRGTVITTQVMQ